MRLTRYGLSVEADPAWDSRIYRRTAAGSERTHPVVHLCTRALPAERGDFGSGVVEKLSPDDVFVALLEFDADDAGQGLFSRRGMPRLAPSQFSAGRMPRVLPGRSAAQHFFTEGDRAFCLYVVIGSHARRMALVPRAAGLLRTFAVSDKATMLRAGGLP